MLRMAHRLISSPIQIATKNDGTGRHEARVEPDLIAKLEASISLAQIVLGNNVAEYVFEHSDKTWDRNDFPYLIPPFDRTFIEYDIKDHEWLTQIGVLFEVCRDMKQWKRWKWSSEVTMTVTAFLFATTNEGKAVHFDGHLCMGMRPDGSLVQQFGSQNLWNMLVVPAFLAVSFLHCKRVQKLVDVTVEPAPKWLRRTKSPRLVYHVLEINPMKEIIRTEGNIDANGPKKALHICRGHFATYTAEKPLFGNIVGTVWKSAHVRGDIKQGAVVKDYSVSPKL